MRYKQKLLEQSVVASDLSNHLLDEIKKNHFLEYAEVKKHHTKEFGQFHILPNMLEAISKIKCDIPCSVGGDGCGGSCLIMACVKEKNINHLPEKVYIYKR